MPRHIESLKLAKLWTRFKWPFSGLKQLEYAFVFHGFVISPAYTWNCSTIDSTYCTPMWPSIGCNLWAFVLFSIQKYFDSKISKALHYYNFKMSSQHHTLHTIGKKNDLLPPLLLLLAGPMMKFKWFKNSLYSHDTSIGCAPLFQ